MRVVIAWYNASGLRVHPEIERPTLAVRGRRSPGVLVEQAVQPSAELLQVGRREPQAEPGALQPRLAHRGDLLQEGGEDRVVRRRRAVVDVHEPALARGPVRDLPGAAGTAP